MVLVLAASMVLRLADWTLKVVVYEPAVLSPATGTTAAFTIPVRFNGDTVRTMAGYYPDGTYSAPDDWTAYKQYGYVFDPEEATGTIKMQTICWEFCERARWCWRSPSTAVPP